MLLILAEMVKDDPDDDKFIECARDVKDKELNVGQGQ